MIQLWSINIAVKLSLHLTGLAEQEAHKDQAAVSHLQEKEEKELRNSQSVILSVYSLGREHTNTSTIQLRWAINKASLTST